MMTIVPAGEFLTGSRDGEGNDDERPQHKVVIKNRFAVSIAPITRGEFAAFVEDTQHNIEVGRQPVMARSGLQAGRRSSGSVRELARPAGLCCVA
jgi:formylglycine-generating enzyme required for sulfatase activity